MRRRTQILIALRLALVTSSAMADTYSDPPKVAVEPPAPAAVATGIFTGPNCKVDQEDPYAPDARLPGTSPYAGECLDTRKVRGLRAVSPDHLRREFGVEPRPGTRVVANFRHQQQFWIAEFPLGGVRQVLMQQESGFGGVPFHHQTRFINDPDRPVRLFPQTPKQMKSYSGPLLVHDYVVSAIGLRPASLADQGYSMRHGLGGSYAQGVGMVSMEDAWVHDAKVLGHELWQTRLLMDRAQRSELLEFHIDRSIEIGETRLYHVLTDNCVTEIFLGYAKIARVRKPFRTGHHSAIGDTQAMPFNTLNKLRLLNLVPKANWQPEESAARPFIDTDDRGPFDPGVAPMSEEWGENLPPTPLTD